MEYEGGKIGRVFYLRVDEGDDLLECLERVAVNEKINSAVALVIGAVHGASVVVGSREPTIPPEPMYRELSDGRELLGIATILRDMEGKPTVHIHGSLARGDDVALGCLREKVPVYLVAETIILEVEGLSAVRAFNERLGVWAPVFEGSDR